MTRMPHDLLNADVAIDLDDGIIIEQKRDAHTLVGFDDDEYKLREWLRRILERHAHYV